uniref:Uncharacterized protein n=1 Tax=Ackermannviridae sp. TaxID=2831612 RepID=A0A8S5RTJ6_9CAUD|nr:MAG TPA: hypothetical protein [Ackermannviridae sp.]
MTTFKWFSPAPATLAEGQALYRKLAATHHPDVADLWNHRAERS